MISFVAVALAVLVLVAVAVGAPDSVVVPPLAEVGAAVVVEFPVPLTARLVLELGEIVVGLFVPLTATLPVEVAGALAVVVVPLGADVVVGLVVPSLAAVVFVTGLVVPLAAVPEPLTVDALTVVEPVALTSPEPVLFAWTVVDPEALVVADKFVGVVVPLSLLPVTGAAVPLAANPEPLTVDALMVVEPAAFTSPDPLPVALTVVDPDALVSAVCAPAGAANAMPTSAAPTAEARVLLRCCIFTMMCVSFAVSPTRTGALAGGTIPGTRERRHEGRLPPACTGKVPAGPDLYDNGGCESDLQ